jgi:hypothetical protein
MAGFDGWTVPVARQAFVFLRAGAHALEGRSGTLVQITGAPARRANPQRGLVSAGMAAVRALARNRPRTARAGHRRVKRRDLDRHLRNHGARLLREGGKPQLLGLRRRTLDRRATASRDRLGIPPPTGSR